MTFTEVKTAIGAPSTKLGFSGLVMATYDKLGLEILFTSAVDTDLSDDAIATAITTTSGAKNVGGKVIPGKTRAEVTTALGDPGETVGELAFFAQGVGVQYQSDKVTRVTVFASYELKPVPPEMAPAE